ncbi:MAG: GTP pyrophosphokinase family protein [Clostridia bacterium]|nr:GTP pyrophosphokinase family protein [Clostridia bacterium]
MDLSPEEIQEIFSQALHMMDWMVEYKELRMMYDCALHAIRTKFEVLDEEFNTRIQRNPIDHIQTRLKSNQSILMKMYRKGVPFNLENMEKTVHDIAGIRIICSYEDDIYTLAEALLSQDDVQLISKKDYIANPKESGYRSLHLIVSIPVYFSRVRREMTVEVQIRTIAMDFWASLEHHMKYKQAIPHEENVIRRLRDCADRAAELDREMLEIRRQIDEAKDPEDPETMMEERLKLLDRGGF